MARRWIGLSPGQPDALSRVDALALTRHGSAAFVVRHPERRYGPAGRLGLRTVEPGRSRRLDKGEGIDPASLQVEGSTVRWTNAGADRSALLR